MASKKKIKVENNPDLVRDSYSKAIINTNRTAYGQWKARKKLLKEKDDKIAQLEADFEKMKQAQTEMMEILSKLTKK